MNLSRVICVTFFLIGSLSFAKDLSEKKAQSRLSLRSLKIGSHVIRVEVADTPETRQRGLMYRESLPKDQGMLFVFPSERPLTFWMKNTTIPLSIGFFNAQRQLLNVHEMEPESVVVRSLRSYESSGPAQYALEMNKGWFSRNKISKGTTFEWVVEENK